MWASNSKLYSLRISILEKIAQEWNLNGVIYGVVHGLEGYPMRIGRDLDVLVDRKDREKAVRLAISVFQREKWIPIVHRKPWAVWITAFYIGGNGEVYSVELDILWRIQWGWTVLAEGVDKSNLYRRSSFQVDPWGSFCKRVLIQILGGNFGKIQKKGEFDIYPEELSVVRGRLRDTFGLELSEAIVRLVNNPSRHRIERYAKILRRSVLLQALRKDPGGIFTNSLTWLYNEISSHVLPKRAAPIVALVGPDGIGKSTTIDVVKEYIKRYLTFTGVSVRHWRPRVLPELGSLIGKPRNTGGSGGFVLPRRRAGPFYLFRLIYYSIDVLIGYVLKDRYESSLLRLVLYDRCFLDAAVDPVRYGFSSGWGVRAMWPLLPKPNVIILLYDDPDRIYTRKPELETNEINRQISEWFKLVERGVVHAAVRVDSSPEVIGMRVVNLIVEEFIKQSNGKDSRWKS